MTNSKHTPGPWINGSYVGKASFICDRNGNDLAKVILGAYLQGRLSEAQANARLVAAAPCLLVALKQVLYLLPDYPPHDPNRHIVDTARKAMHKAEGNA